MGKRKTAERGERVAIVSKASGIVEAANALSQEKFIESWNRIIPNQLDSLMARLPTYTIALNYAEQLKERHLCACFRLIEQTSRQDYEPSSFGWYPKRKLREMKEKEMRYVILRNVVTDDVEAFLSFMLTYDSTPSVPVLYVYEIHLHESLRGKGVGKALMRLAEDVAASVGVEKVMLTCFKVNTTAWAFYEHLGYAVDVCSPEDRRTRNKVVKTDYVILSKAVTPQRSPAVANAIL